MAKADKIADEMFVKMLNIGVSGSGKTCSLMSLLEDGYEIGILDMDNNSSSLIQLIKKKNPALLKQLDIISLRDKMRASQSLGLEVSGPPKAFVNMLKYLNEWDDGSKPQDWGPKKILVVDTLSSVGRSAFHWAKGMNPTVKDGRQWYAQAGEAIQSFIELLTSPEFKTNVIVLSHIELVDMPDNSVKGFVSSLGKALGPKIPRTFPTLVVTESKGSGTNVKRTISTTPSMLVDMKNPVPWKLQSSLPIETGMATIFKELLAS